MKLYKVFNGYLGNGQVSTLVTAENEGKAKELAKIAFQKDSTHRIKTKSKGFTRIYGPNYWNSLEVEVVFEDCSKENFSKVTD